MKTAPWIIIIVLIVLLVIQRECHRCPECPEIEQVSSQSTTTNVVVPGDSIVIKGDTVWLDAKPVIIIDTVFEQLPIDTNAILADYYARKQGRWILVDDTSLFVAINFEVYKNRLQWVVPETQNRRPVLVQINETYNLYQEVIKARNKYFGGIGIGRSPESFGLAPSLALLNRKNNLYSLSYDVLNKDFYFTIYFQLR